MNPIVFIDDDAAYHRWCQANPDGYVVNVRRNPTPDLFCLHRTSRRCIRVAPSTRHNPFTGRDYIKVCSDCIQALLQWGQAHGIPGFASTQGGNGECMICRPCA
jgi:hypothetical protein